MCLKNGENKLTIHHETAATNKLTISAHILASGKLVELLALLLSKKGDLSLYCRSMLANRSLQR